MNNFERLGLRVRELRLKCGLSQRAVADTLDVDFSYISKIECARLTAMPSFELLARMASLYNVPANELHQLAGKLNLHRLQQIALSDERASRLLYKIQSGELTEAQWAALTDEA